MTAPAPYLRLLARAAVALALLPSLAHAAVHTHSPNGRRPAPEPSPWQRALTAGDAFDALTAPRHTRAAYARVIAGFRAVYFTNPADPHAAEAVEAVASLLADESSDFADPRLAQQAAKQYDFLRTNYPASAPARAAARKEAALLKPTHPAAAKAAPLPVPTHNTKTLPPAAPEPTRRARATAAPPLGVPPHTPAQVTGIRHWSTPTYTRVAIDLGDEVTFAAARVPNPDRLFFDLHGAHLAPELLNKSFDVTDDGFLTKIRAAQPSPDTTRVVLDVSDVTVYSAFLLPNPFRLIIDIHGAPAARTNPTKPAARETETAEASTPLPPAASRRATAAANASGLPPMAPTDGGDLVRPAPPADSPKPRTPAPRVGIVTPPSQARPVPNTLAVPAPATSTEVAALSTQPGKVAATSAAPSSRPIAAVVKLKPTPDRRPDAAPTKAADRTADGETSLIRALGLKINRIVIDAGHGGHDSGTLGFDGIQEKDVVLDVALRTGKLLHERLGAEIIYTRSDDTFIPLETRTAIANKAQADLFLSIHANSSQDESARGVETYYLNFTSSPDALDVAARENAVSGQSIHQLSDLVKKIALKDKIAESRIFASDVESSLFGGLQKGNAGLKDRGVKKAPFVVLIGANMPSILAEISFVTNPKDAEQLRTPDYRQRVAESLFAGVARYQSSLAGARPAAPMVRASTQQEKPQR